MTTSVNTWDKLLDRVKSRVSINTFNTWFQPTRLDRTEGETRMTRRHTAVPIRFAGFNLGDYERTMTSVPGFNVEVYGNRRLESALQLLRR